MHQGETFDLDLICRHLDITKPENRHEVVKKLAYEVKQGKLEKSNRIYKYVNTNIKYIDWVNTPDYDYFPIKWPCSHLDGSSFGFDEHIKISPNDVIVIAGGSNYGKTAFCQNLLFENMHDFPCVMMVNEYSPGRFKRRINRMDWTSPFNGDGLPCFELIERHEDWKYAVKPGAINIIDWINLTENLWLIGSVIEGIQSRLAGGVAVISLQKDDDKTLGRGRGWAKDFASVYLTMDYERLTVIKVKEWQNVNINNKMYGFTIEDQGSQFANIREIKPCPKCGSRCLASHTDCGVCNSKGFVDVMEE